MTVGVDDDQTTLTAAQIEVLETLGATGDERPRFPPNLGRDLRAALNTELTQLLDGEPADTEVFVNKRTLGMVHGCRTLWLHEDTTNDFEWTPAIARGSVSHKAIELGIHWPADPAPLDMVDEAMASYEHGDSSLGYYIQGIEPADRAELRARAGERVSAFFECFPPIEPRWKPVTEGWMKQTLAHDRVILRGKPDLTLGVARGAQAGKVVVDLKTGTPMQDHRADLRFYALIDAMMQGTPPRLLVTYYLDQARPVTEPVTEAVLEAEMARVIDGVRLMIELRTGEREPDLAPSPSCRWCPLLDRCEAGPRFLEDRADQLGLEE
jgi:CRISPR/Cas system-associated exonuclease Cas4 (RecB family)